MGNLLYSTAIKYALIAVGLSLLTSLPYIILGYDNETAMGLSTALSFFNILAALIIYVVGILEFSKKRNHNASPNEIFGLAAMIAGIVLLFNIIWSALVIKFFAPPVALSEYGDYTPDVNSMMLLSFSVTSCMSFVLAAGGLIISGMWRTFQKAGKEGWESIVPVYNYMVASEIGKNPNWWGLLVIIPLAGLVFAILILNGIAKAFGKDGAWTIGLIFLGFIFWPLLAWGDARYQYGNFETPPPPSEPDVSEHLVE